MAKRSKQINVSIPQESLGLLEDFDAICKAQNFSRSEVLLGCITEYVWRHEQELNRIEELCEHSAQEDELPEWLR